jgi:hypothetical protein
VERQAIRPWRRSVHLQALASRLRKMAHEAETLAADAGLRQRTAGKQRGPTRNPMQ